MRKRELDKFRKLLTEQRAQIVQHVQSAEPDESHVDPDDFPDEVDTASSEVSRAVQGRMRERERALLAKIDGALRKLDDGSYGECERCGEDIGIKRLRARPVAELCIDCKSQQEKLERR